MANRHKEQPRLPPIAPIRWSLYAPLDQLPHSQKPQSRENRDVNDRIDDVPVWAFDNAYPHGGGSVTGVVLQRTCALTGSHYRGSRRPLQRDIGINGVSGICG
jgi:hypothetical protein